MTLQDKILKRKLKKKESQKLKIIEGRKNVAAAQKGKTLHNYTFVHV
jgi:hypothetical protein